MEPLERAERANDSQYLSELFQLEEYGDRGHTVKKDKGESGAPRNKSHGGREVRCYVCDRIWKYVHASERIEVND